MRELFLFLRVQGLMKPMRDEWLLLSVCLSQYVLLPSLLFSIFIFIIFFSFA